MTPVSSTVTPNPAGAKPRNVIVDHFKNISITGVVFIHVCGGFIDGAETKPVFGDRDFLASLLRYALRFAVPIFIIFWAYFYQQGLKRQENPAKYRNKRFIHLFRVFLFWSALYVIAWTPWRALPRAMLSSLPWTGNGWPGQYYLITLFQLIIVFPLLQWLAKTNLRVLLTVVITFIVYVFMFLYVERLPRPVLVFSYRPFIYWMAYAVVGIWLTTQPRRNVSYWWLLLLLLIPLEYLVTDPPPLHLMRYIRPGVYIGSLAVAPFLIHKALSVPRPTAFNKLLNFSANNTLTVFVLHPLLILALPYARINQLTGGLDQWSFLLFNLVMAMIIYFICLGVAWLINQTPLKGYIN